MTRDHDIDVLVIGAGPAGVCAALRLQQLGYQVAVVERMRLPRANIGESLTPGVRNILDLLDASDAIATVPVLTNLQTHLLWDTREPALVPQHPSGGSMMIDRGAFDHALFRLVGTRGGLGIAPGEIGKIEGVPGAWRVPIQHDQQSSRISARLILDARGRSATPNAPRIALAPPLLALWAKIAGAGAPTETQVEALANGWLWGSPLPDGAYRVMTFCDPSTLRQAMRGQPEQWLRACMAQSRLFAELAQRRFLAPVQACASTPYVDAQAWAEGQLKLGDAAFAIDPLSSSGVEKAMRFSLQAAVAVHTLLSDATAAPLAQEFFQDRLLDCVARHRLWTRRYYQQAWPGAAHDFWRSRSVEFEVGVSDCSPFAAALRQACSNITTPEKQQPAQTVKTPPLHSLSRAALLNGSIALSPDLAFVELPCVVDNRVQLRQAISHPNLDRPVAYVAGQEIASLLHVVAHVASLSTAIELWAHRMPPHTASSIAAWLCQKGVLQLATPSYSPRVAPADLTGIRRS